MRSTPPAVRQRLAAALRDCVAEGIGEEEIGRRLLAIEPNYPPGLIALGSARLAANDLDGAETLLWQALATAPSNPGMYFPLSAVCRERGDDDMMARLVAVALWKVSFYEDVPEGVAAAIAKTVPELGKKKQDPEAYEEMAEGMEAGLKGPWPERLLPYRLLNEVQKQAMGGLDPDLVKEIVANGAACAPVFEAAAREVYESEQSSLSIESESLVTALLGEIGRVELIDELLRPEEEVFLHSHWAAFRLGQRFPAEAFGRLHELGRETDFDLRTCVAQHLYFLREHGDARSAIRELADGISFEGGGDAAAGLLVTITSLLDELGAAGEALELTQRHTRKLSKEGAATLNDGWPASLVVEGIDQLDIEGVCVDLALMEEYEDAHGIELEEEEGDEFDEEEPAPKPGRNDPCWCGSGKKYKKCHLQADEESEREQAKREPEEELFGTAWGQLLDAAANYYSSAETKRAIERFIGEPADDITGDTLAELGFFDWFVLDYRSERNGRTVAEEFLRRRGPRVTDEARTLMESWISGRHGLWEVRRIEGGRGLEIRDAFAGDTLYVENDVVEAKLKPGDYLLHRVHRFQERWLFSGRGVLVGEKSANRIREEVASGGAKEGLSAAEYFRSRSHDWRRFVLEEQAEVGD
jgi:hypothetical protein